MKLLQSYKVIPVSKAIKIKKIIWQTKLNVLKTKHLRFTSSHRKKFTSWTNLIEPLLMKIIYKQLDKRGSIAVGALGVESEE